MAAKPTPDVEFDYDLVDPEAQDRRQEIYPYIQWVNGDKKLKNLGGIAYTGGFAFPVEQDSSVRLTGWKAQQLTFDSGESVDVLGASQAKFAVIRTRACWIEETDNGTRRFPLKAYRQGMRKKTQALVLAPGCDSLLMLTFKGMVGDSFNRALDAHWTKVVSAANRTAPQGKKLPSYAFWVELKAGAPKLVGNNGKQSEITPIEIVLPPTIDRPYLLAQYVGRDALVRSQQLWRETAEWKEAWDKGGDEEHAAASADEWACGAELADKFQDLLDELKRADGQAAVAAVTRQVLSVAGVDDLARLTPSQMHDAIGYAEMAVASNKRGRRAALSAVPPEHEVFGDDEF